MKRRDFLKMTALGSAGVVAGGLRGVSRYGCVQAAIVEAPDHFVPVEKQLSQEWMINGLFAKGGKTVYSGSNLDTIGMPCGGICAGQFYVTGDGRFGYWDLFNQGKFTGYGATNYALGLVPAQPVDHGFAVSVRCDGKEVVRSLDRKGFSNVRFCGEYPVAWVDYEDVDVPVHVTLECFSPFIPLNAPDSGLPATILQFTIKNTSAASAEVTLAGWLQNAVCMHTGGSFSGQITNALAKGRGMTMVQSSAKAVEPAESDRPVIVFADFEGGDYGAWKIEGEAFGKKPAGGTLDNQQEVSGFIGQGLVNTYLGGNDRLQGKLTSPAFTIERRFINFLIGGGGHDKTCMNLLIDGKVVRTAKGKNNEKLEWQSFNVKEFEGKEACIEIVDAESGGWGHINIDQIEFADKPRSGPGGKLEEQQDFGTMGLAVLAEGKQSVVSSLSLPAGDLPAQMFVDGGLADDGKATRGLGELLRGALGKKITLKPGKKQQVTFVLSWCFPNRRTCNKLVGNAYAKRFKSAADVTKYIAQNIKRLAGQTRLWHDTYYDSTLPHWLLDRLHSTASTLATETCQWWANGRFWAWEGVGCCHGTCAHVWNYEHTMARLFPELERSVREMQDFEPTAGFNEATGAIAFRGEGWGMWAADGQAGTVLKAYREHQVSADEAFLKRNWPRIKKALEFLIQEDANNDGILEGKQHNTYDIEFYGANPMIGSLYLASLRAGEEMAAELGDKAFAEQCRALFDKGIKYTEEKLFNGEYFIQTVDHARYPDAQYGDGCLSDQVFGQGWAFQTGLGYVYPKEQTKSALQAIWKYNWAPDVGPQNEAHKPERWFARPGEAGLFTCTWPKSRHMGPKSVRYRDEVWTGIEYQVAGHMAWEGMVTEALAICRAIHERYHPSKHNPWNEIECGDHYARGMASWGVLLGLCGYEYHGPKGRLGFAPRITPEDFKAVFTAAEGWGSISQKRTDGMQTNTIEVKWGRLCLKEIALALPERTEPKTVKVRVNRKQLRATFKKDGDRIVVSLPKDTVVQAGQSIVVEIA
jgi:non-lysosomal glucosylceramidase